MDGVDDPTIACSLSPTDVPDRLGEWQSLLASVVDRIEIDGGARLLLAPGTDVRRVAELAGKEHECCPFFEFDIHLGREGLALDVRAPADAAPIIEALLGS
jgi:hypothetical protein